MARTDPATSRSRGRRRRRTGRDGVGVRRQRTWPASPEGRPVEAARSALQGQGLFGAVLDARPGVVLAPGRDLVHQQDAVAVVVGVEEIGSEHVTAAVALAALGVELDVHGRVCQTAGGKVQGQVVQRPQTLGVLEHGARNEFVLRDPLVPFAHGHPQFDAGQVRAEAAVDTAAEGEMGIGVAQQVDGVDAGVGGVSVLAAPMSSMTCSPARIGQPSTSTSSAKHPGDGGHGTLPAQQLLDGRRDHRLVRRHLTAVLGFLGEIAEDAVEGVGHRVEPGDDEEEADVEDLLVGELHPVDLGPHDPGQQVLGGGPPPLGQRLLEVGVDARRPSASASAPAPPWSCPRAG